MMLPATDHVESRISNLEGSSSFPIDLLPPFPNNNAWPHHVITVAQHAIQAHAPFRVLAPATRVSFGVLHILGPGTSPSG